MHPDNKRALENRVTGAAEAQGIAEHTAVRGSGLDRVLAREQVRDRVEETLAAWRGSAG